MERYAQVVDGIVHQVIESGIDPDGTNGEWIACGNAGPGWLYDGATFAPPDPAPVSRTITKVAYLKRFTQTERIGIREAAKVNAVVEDYLELLNLEQDVDLADPETIAGVQQLEAAGLLATGRAAEILA